MPFARSGSGERSAIVTLRNDMAEHRQHYGLTLGILTMAAASYALQQTMVIPALPELQRELGASTTWVTWVMTGFLLSAAVLTPILGKLGDRFGKERLLVLSLVAFLVGCIGCALAPNIWIADRCSGSCPAPPAPSSR